MFKIIKIFFIVVLNFVIAASVHAQATLSAEVSITPAGDFVAKISGVGSVKKSGNKYVSNNVKFDLRKLSTGIKLRDEHAQKYLHTQEFPFAELISAEGSDGAGKATIKFKGVQKEINGTYKVEGSFFLAEFNISLSDFKVEGINFKGAGVDDEVKVQVKIPIVE